MQPPLTGLSNIGVVCDMTSISGHLTSPFNITFGSVSGVKAMSGICYTHKMKDAICFNFATKLYRSAFEYGRTSDMVGIVIYGW